MLKDHAEHMLDKVLTNPNVTAEKLQQMPESERKMLKERVDTADKVSDAVEECDLDWE